MKRLNLALAVGSLLFLAACGSDTTAKDTTDNGGTTGGETGGTTGGEVVPAAQLAEPLAVQPAEHVISKALK